MYNDLANSPKICDNKITGLMGDSVSENIEDIFDWIKENCKGGAQFRGLTMLYSIEFDDHEDIALFTLRWL